MSTKIGHFEILSELAKSETGAVYKANDLESGQTVALKAIQLSAFGESTAALHEALLKEVESVKVLTSPNLTCVLSGCEIEGQFCAPMEYIQGNSIATMLARKEGFSIWDLLDIGRQLCSGFDHASSHGLVHYSLEPSKIMCGWDGTVRILSFGVSSVGNFVQHAAGVSSILHYMSPEQVRGEVVDGRSNLFSLGAILYEMVTERKAFDADNLESLRQSILEIMPPPPIQFNAKVHPLLSDLIMKALAKDPAQRYQTGKDLLAQLENCKETRPAKKAEPPKSTVASGQMKAAAQAKFVGSTPAPSAPAVAPPAPAPSPVAAAPAPKPSRLAMPKTAAAAAGVGSSVVSSTPSPDSAPNPVSDSVNATDEAAGVTPAEMSSAVADEPQVEPSEPQVNADAPKIAIDPLMAEDQPTGPPSASFSEISELPPLKEVYVAPPPPPPVDLPPVKLVTPLASVSRRKLEEKPKIQPRVVAAKAIKEIKGVPPKLMMYAMAGAGILILAIAIGVTIYIHSQSDDDSGASRQPAPAVAQTAPQPEATQPAPQQQAAPAPTPADTPPADAQPAETNDAAASTPEPTEPAQRRSPRKRAAPATIPGQLTVDSTPQGAQIQFDGQSDPSWVTPVALTNIQPGQHSITVTKPGYSTDTRAVNVASGSHANAMIHLSQLMATLIVKSDPAGANIYVDGHDVGTRTPAQVTVNKGQHVVLVRMSGYLDETMSKQFVLGQTFNFSPTLRPLGNVDSIKTVGKMSKLFGKGGREMGTISIHTQPKGAQVAINQHLLDKNSPVDVMIDPGNYVIDITLSGYAPVHKVVNAEKGNKTVVDEVLQPQ